MCFYYHCVSCEQVKAYYCGPPNADPTNDIPPRLCRKNAHAQHTGFKCMTCERLDGVTGSLEAWLKFHSKRRDTSTKATQTTASVKTSIPVRARINPEDPRSPWYNYQVTITNLKRALTVSGVDYDTMEGIIIAEQQLRLNPPDEDDIKVTAIHTRDYCCFCLDNFTAIPQPVTPALTPGDESSSEGSSEPITPQAPPSEPLTCMFTDDHLVERSTKHRETKSSTTRNQNQCHNQNLQARKLRAVKSQLTTRRKRVNSAENPGQKFKKPRKWPCY